MNQVAFFILFLYVRSFEFSRYPRDFGDEKRDLESSDELNIDDLNRKEEEKLLEKHHQVEAKYFLERQTFL